MSAPQLSHNVKDLLIAALGGVAWGLCFEQEASLWLGWVALIPLCFVAVSDRAPRRVAWLGLVHGWFAWMVQMPWIPTTIITFGNIPTALAWVLMGLLAVYLGLYHVAFAWLVRVAPRRWALVAAPAFWVVLEWLRGHAVGSFNFPWNLAAYAWVDVVGVLPLSAWIGPYGLSVLVVGINAYFALCLRQGDRREGILRAGFAFCLVLTLLISAARFSQPEDPLPLATDHRVRLVQPNQQLAPDDPNDIARNYQSMMLTAESECRGVPTLLVLPESAAWPQTWENSFRLRRDMTRLAERGCDTIFNSPMTRPDAGENFYTNSAVLITPDGVLERYDKRYLVPFGEHVPLGNVLPFVRKIARHAGSFAAGQDAGLMAWQGEEIGLLICYEVVFPDAVTVAVRDGASFLVNISNDAWYGDSSAPYQLFRAARFRAAESRRTLLRSALTGISGVIGPRGEVLAQLGLGERDVIRTQVTGRQELTPYLKAPWLVPVACSIIALFAIFLAWNERRKKGS